MTVTFGVSEVSFVPEAWPSSPEEELSRCQNAAILVLFLYSKEVPEVPKCPGLLCKSFVPFAHMTAFSHTSLLLRENLQLFFTFITAIEVYCV